VSESKAFSDDALVELLRRGDEDAFASLYRLHQTRLYRFAYHMSGSHSIAEDSVQETFLALMRQPERFDPERGNVSAYLFGIARNHVLRAIERERRLDPLEAEETASGANVHANGQLPAHERAIEGIERAGYDGAGALAHLERHERIEGVRRAVLLLPPTYREVVVLCDLEQRTYADVAERLGCPVGTVRSRLNRARGLLLAKLGTRVTHENAAASETGRTQRMRAGGRI
jgi:RNA polymerase sigma-70 factor (ECF subfamily)